MSPLLLLVAICSAQVGGGSGSAARIQAAIDACPEAGCTIELPDAAYPLDRQIWIANKQNVTIRSSGTTPARLFWEDSLLAPDTSGTAKLFWLPPPAGGGRPDLPAGWLRWPTAYMGGTGTLADTTNPYASNGHQHNGMILVKESRSVGLERLRIDGIRPATLVNKYVWNYNTDLVHGSVGVCLLRSRDVRIVDCDLRGHWAAVYMNDRNPKCAGWNSGTTDKRWSSCGLVGGHLIEGNRIHGNKFGVYSEAAWDLGSVIRDNVAWDNREHREPGASVLPKIAMDRYENYSVTGGFLLVKDVVFPAHVVTRNTIVDTGASRPYGGTNYRATPNALWSDNLIELRSNMPDSLSRQITHQNHLWSRGGSHHLWNSAILSMLTRSGLTNTNSAYVVDSNVLESHTKLVLRDSLEGKVDGGYQIARQGAPYDTAIDGRDTTLHRVRWVTFLYDTLIEKGAPCTKTNPCFVYVDPPVQRLNNSPGQIWYATLRSEPFDVSYRFLNDPNPHVGAVVSGYTIDSTTAFRLETRLMKDTSWVWDRKMIFSADARLKRTDTASPAFLSLDTASAGGRKILGHLDAKRTWPGAYGPRGLMQEPVRVRARGHGRWDKSGSLLLPVGIDGELAGISKLVIRNAWIAARPLDQSGLSSLNLEERRISVTSLPEIAPTDTVIRIPFTDAGSDSLYQVDLWFSAIAGTDTVDVTPMAWSVCKLMTGSLNTVGVTRAKAAPRWNRRGQFLYLAGFEGTRAIEFVDARGVRVKLPVQTTSRGTFVDLSALRPGLWIPRLPGAKAMAITG